MSYFHDAKVDLEGQILEFSAQEGAALENTGNYWHAPKDPSTWLAVSVFQAVHRKFPNSPQDVRLKLAAQNLGITADQLISAIEWHENYMRWHDGDDSYRVLE